MGHRYDIKERRDCDHITYSYSIVSVHKASHPLQRWQLDSCDWIAACRRTFVYMEATGAQGNAALLSHRLTLQVGEIVTVAAACRVMADRLDVYPPVSGRSCAGP
jgi:hypothetical protein